MSELVITEKNLLKLQQICDANLLNEILEEVIKSYLEINLI